MEFEWDEAKNQANIAKHGIAFAEAARIFEDLVLTEPDRRRHYGEERHLSIGRMAPNVSIVVAHTPAEPPGTPDFCTARKPPGEAEVP